jgi:ABC-2 type transport system permease protein
MPALATDAEVAGVDPETESQVGAAVILEAPANLAVSILPVALPLAYLPESIEGGIDCGMADMCGLDPCLCGNPDAWGACACNGLRKTAVQIGVVVTDPTVATVLRIGDAWWLLPLGQGSTALEVQASLPHHLPASATIELRVDTPIPPPVIWCVTGVALLVLVVAVVVRVVRKLNARRVHKDLLDSEAGRQ